MNYKEAKAATLGVRLKVKACDSKNCWCALIVPETPVQYTHKGRNDEIGYIINAGGVPKEWAERFVALHNADLERQEQNLRLAALEAEGGGIPNH